MSGCERFMVELKELGFECEQRGQLVVVTMDVSPPDLPSPHMVGVEPPSDFPNVPPHWLHLSSDLALPEGKPRQSELGVGWQKWSRKHPKWPPGAGAREWVAHVRSLLLSAYKV